MILADKRGWGPVFLLKESPTDREVGMLRHKALTLAGVAFALVALATPASGAGKERVLFRFN